LEVLEGVRPALLLLGVGVIGALGEVLGGVAVLGAS